MSSPRFHIRPISVSKLFAYDTLLFSVVHNINTLADEVNNDLVKINKLADCWKMSFNPDTIKQAKEK